jgi:hypothetical protein
MASRKGSRTGWRWVAVGATLAAGVAVYGGRRRSRRSRRAMSRGRADRAADFSTAPGMPRPAGPPAGEPVRPGAAAPAT